MGLAEGDDGVMAIQPFEPCALDGDVHALIRDGENDFRAAALGQPVREQAAQRRDHGKQPRLQHLALHHVHDMMATLPRKTDARAFRSIDRMQHGPASAARRRQVSRCDLIGHNSLRFQRVQHTFCNKV